MHRFTDFPVCSAVKNLPTMQMWFQSLGWEDPLEMEMTAHSSILAMDSHGQGVARELDMI